MTDHAITTTTTTTTTTKSIPAADLIAALNKRDAEVINGALTNWLNSPLSTLKSTANELIQNEDLATAIEKSLDAPGAGHTDDFVCRWLYHWYQVDAVEPRRFVLRFIPQLLWVYLYNIANSEVLAGVEACLLCIYNHEVVERNDMEIVFNPPTLSLPSYLHKSQQSTTLATFGNDLLLTTTPAPTLAPTPPQAGTITSSGAMLAPPATSGSMLTENALRQFNRQVRKVTVEKPLGPIDLVTASNREALVRVNLQRFNSNISLFPPRSWVSYCKMCKRLAGNGFDFSFAPMPLLKSKAFLKKYMEDDLDNIIGESEFEDEEVEEEEDDDFGDEQSDSDGDKEKDVESGSSPEPESAIPNGKKEKAKSPKGSTPLAKRRLHGKREGSTGSVGSNASSTKPKNVPPLSLNKEGNTSDSKGSPHTPSSASSVRSATSSSAPSPSSSSQPPNLAAMNLNENPPTTTTTTTTTTNNNNSHHHHHHHHHHHSEHHEHHEHHTKPTDIAKPPVKKPVRIVLPTSCLQEMVTGLTFCLFKDSYKENALKSLRKIHLRACYELIPEVLLSSNALLHLEFQERAKPSTGHTKLPHDR